MTRRTSWQRDQDASTLTPVTTPSAPRKYGRLGRLTSLGALILLVATACGNKPLDTLAPNSPIGGEINRLFWGVFIIAIIVFFLVQGAVIYMVRRFGVDSDDPDELYPDEEFPEQIHGNDRLEYMWTALPALLLVVISVFTLLTQFRLDDVSASENRRVQSVTVIGQQWWWEFQYDLDGDGNTDIVTANELVIPVGEEIALDVTSRDVIHSFWIPRLNGKRDAVPGRTSPWTIEAGKADRFAGECTEFCGLSHAYMEMWVVGLEPADWDTWAANQVEDAEAPTDEAALAGWEVFQAQCASCHMINGLTERADPLDDSEDPAVTVDSLAKYDGANRLIPKSSQVAGAAPNLTHFATRSTFAGSVFDLYIEPHELDYLTLATDAKLNRGDLEAWIRNAPEQKANFWDSPTGQRGMTPFTSMSDDDMDHLVTFLLTLD